MSIRKALAITAVFSGLVAIDVLELQAQEGDLCGDQCKRCMLIGKEGTGPAGPSYNIDCDHLFCVACEEGLVSDDTPDAFQILERVRSESLERCSWR